MAPKSTPSTAFRPAAKSFISIFQDEARSTSAASGDANNENIQSSHAQLSKFTREAVNRPRSLSSALAEIAGLEDKLEAYKGEARKLKAKNRKLKGEIVAYQDALYQADVDAGYL